MTHARSPALRGSESLPLLEAMRPRQWSKNVFVLAGIVFAGRLFEARAELRVLACFALFCAASSAERPRIAGTSTRGINFATRS